MAQAFTAAQVALLRILFAQAGPGLIPGSWLVSHSVTAEQIEHYTLTIAHMDAQVYEMLVWGQVAYSWGDHSVAGYLTAETDPVFGASPAAGITAGLVVNWNLAFSWGDHSTAGYLTVESDPVFLASAAAAIVAGDIANWNAAFGWGDHSTAGYAVTPAGVLTIANWCTAGFLNGATVAECEILAPQGSDGVTHRYKVLAIDQGVA